MFKTRVMNWEIKEKYRTQAYIFLSSQKYGGLTHLAFRLNDSLSILISFPVVPLTIICTFILGILTVLTFGILAWLTTAIWLVFLMPLIATSWLWMKIPIIRIVLLVPGILLARAAGIIACIFPSMGEWSSRKMKIDLCDIWPLSLELFRLSGKIPEDSI